MPHVLGLTLLFALAPPPSFEVSGDVRDALYLAGSDESAGVWLSRSGRGGERQMVRLGERGADEGRVVRVPEGAVAVDACAGRGLVFSDARGVVGSDGTRLLEGAVLLAVPDPTALYVAPLCGDVAESTAELRIAVHGGLRVLAADGSVVTLPFQHRARAYSGQVQRGLRASRPYALALSLYAPHLNDADVNGDGKIDLVVVHEGRAGVFLRAADGKLSAKGAVVRELTSRLSGSDDVDVRVLTGDVDGDARDDVVVSLTEGAVPERSSVRVLAGKALLDKGSPRLLWQRDGLSAPLGLVTRPRGEAIVVGEVDTSLVALGAALFTGEVPLKVRLHEPSGRGSARVLELTAQLDVRGGRMAGAMPVVSVDFDGDGREDLLDLGRPGRAALHPGSDTGFLKEPVAEWRVSAFSHVVPLPALPGVVLVGEPAGGKTRVTVVSGGKARAARR